MPVKPFKAVLLLVLISCNNPPSGKASETGPAHPKDTVATYFSTISAIPLPDGYARINATQDSFTEWLRSLRLKNSTTVYLFNGQEKKNQSAQFAVLDISVGTKDLQQCADAVMRLRAEYLCEQKKYDAILFTDNEGTDYRFKPPYSRPAFDNYLQRVFGMCGSASLAKQLKPSSLSAIKPGDVIIRGGFPGHAVMVMDVARDDEGKKIFLLAQSYMPAQDIHVLKNPMNEGLSPWYAADEMTEIITPEYAFTLDEVRQW
ncbi:DUF4846 domain-containing protein [Ferruginibacter sp. HRS2-29]|uniref:DUF4846 domain-containing protein n=1 Tax=Ferruginibacter sp. HRS2-29 TaxID=2487334 RepID=UPI0020CE6E76|nr:DUF4846 domain-containing protein [Ferruginibacter sp. HRS2-29]MCP9750087.1 hypothetical protein [Ferruginibacter sp. HRS2-29]